MKYVCLVYYAEAEVGQMSPEDWLALNYECVAFGDDIAASGHRLGGAALEPTPTAVTVRVRGGQTTVTDGPFAETREQLAGFYLLEARDLDDAVRTAARIPPARLGSIEIRPVRELPVPPSEV
jgi:hypothetical protein